MVTWICHPDDFLPEYVDKISAQMEERWAKPCAKHGFSFRFVSQTGQNYIVQEYLPNRGDLRVAMVEGKVVASMLRSPAEGSYLSNISQGGSASANPDVAAVMHDVERIVASLQADYLCVDWLLTYDGPVLGEWGRPWPSSPACPSPPGSSSPTRSSPGSADCSPTARPSPRPTRPADHGRQQDGGERPADDGPPARRQVAFRALNALWVMQIGQAPTRITDDGYFNSDPDWSPDSSSRSQH
ncbi:hypothetical protein [Streptomyces sp. NPDC086989]|uniref:hypothetical protein n=1 Tax=Streptomyces sp. NPDC086989 TaxID=3365764 RepID=UPI0038141AB5